MSPLELVTRVAHAGWDEHGWCGYQLYAELAGEEGFTGMLALAVSGRRLPPEGRAVLDDIATVVTVADPRIWPLKITRVVAAYGSIYPAYAAGNLALERAMIGFSSCEQAAENLVNLREAVQDPEDAAALEAVVRERYDSKRPPVGFGVPFRPRDERVVALRGCLERRGRTGLPHWRFFELAATVVRGAKRLEPNIGLGLAAACLDLGFRPHEIGVLAMGLVQNAFIGNALEGARQAPAILRKLPDERVRYVGERPRESPRARAARAAEVGSDGARG